jgi:ferric-dicitrate binding protein FerR (iron transport regulator)
MTRDPGNHFDEGQRDLSFEESRALEALSRLEMPRSSPVAREAAREAFLASSQASRSARPTSRRLRWFAVAAAVVGVAAVAVYGSLSTGTWTVTDVLEASRIEGPTITLEKGSSLSGGTVSTGEGAELELQLEQALRLRLLNHTRVDLPTAPGRWWAKSRTLKLTAGELYGTTGGRPLGFSLTIETPEATAELTGTTFAVFRTEEATCVCLYKGSIQVTPRREGPAVRVPPERRVFVYRDGRSPSVEPLTDMERAKLEMTAQGGLLPHLPAKNPNAER